MRPLLFRALPVVVLAAAVLTVAPSAPAGATTPGWIDRSYGQDGFATLPKRGLTSIDPSGRIVLAVPGTGSFTLTRIGVDGATNAGTTVQLPDPTSPVALQALADGSVLVATPASDGSRPTLRLVTAGDALDAGFGASALPVPDAAPRVVGPMRELPGGDLLVAATGATDSLLWRLSPDGRLRTGWGTAGRVRLPGLALRDVAASGDQILVTGQATGKVQVVTRLTGAGAVDPAFGRSGRVSIAGAQLSVSGVMVVDGRIHVVVSRPRSGGQEQEGILRLLAGGARDRSFGDAGFAFSPLLAGTAGALKCRRLDRKVIAQGDGVVLAVSGLNCDRGSVVLTRFGALDGAPDAAFGSGGVLSVTDLGGKEPGGPYGLVVGTQADGRIVLGSNRFEDDEAGVDRLSFAALRFRASFTPVPGGFVPLEPSRLLDTRSGTKPAVGPQKIVRLVVAGRGGVPVQGAATVLLQVTVTRPTAACAITVYSGTGPRPAVSNLNCLAGQTRGNLVAVPVGADGSVRLRNGSTGSADLLADVQGYYRSGDVVDAGAYQALAPVRVLDTRFGTGAPQHQVAAGTTVTLPLGGRTGLPPDASAVVLNTTVVAPSGGGHLTVWPGGTTMPLASTLNFARGATVANLVTVGLGKDGTIALRHTGPGGADLLADLAGYYLGGTPTQPGTFVPLPPARLLDTRESSSAPPAGGRGFSVAGRGGVPTTGASAVVLNLTATGATAGISLTARDSGAPPAVTTSTLNVPEGVTVAGAAVPTFGALGVRLDTSGPGRTHQIADVFGYFRD